MKYDVFISYSRKDTAIADQICAAFDKAGISYFIDRQGIGGGMEFPKVLAPAIRESEVFLLLASQNAYDSAYTDREITFAFNKKHGAKMLPYIIDEAPLPEHLELIFSSNNWRMMTVHPIETVLVEDVRQLLRQTKQESTSINETETKDEEAQSSIPSYNETDFPKPYLKDDKYGYVDSEVNTIIPFIYDFAEDFSEGLASVAINEKYGFIDPKGNVVIPLIYDYSGDFSEGLASVEKNEKWGFINRQGKTVIPFEYDDTSDFSEGLASVEKNEKWGFINRQGKTVIPFEYDDTGDFSEDISIVVKNRKWGAIEKLGNIVIPFEYDEIKEFAEGVAVAKKSGKLGIIDTLGNTVIPFEYEDIIRFTKALVAAKKNEKWLFLNMRGNIAYDETEYTDILLNVDLIRVMKNGKWGYINKQGDIVIPCEYEYAFYFTDGKAKVRKRGFLGSKTIQFDKQGNRID